MKVLIIEDETAASEDLIAILHEIDEDIKVLDVLESVRQSVRWLRANPAPDLIFMDIHLSDGSAFTLFQEIEVETPIIFTTAYNQYAIDAFNVNSIDYLLKPIKISDMTRALEKFRRLTSNDVMAYLQRMVSLGKTHTEGYVSSLLVPVRDKLVPVDVNNVVCIYNTDHKTQIILSDGRNISYGKSLDAIMLSLDPMKFYRANKQYIVSRSYIKEIVIWYDNRLLVNMKLELPEPLYVSKNKASEFKNWMTKT
jgi:DNA-binding LytR/AlgR family response regulator